MESDSGALPTVALGDRGIKCPRLWTAMALGNCKIGDTGQQSNMALTNWGQISLLLFSRPGGKAIWTKPLAYVIVLCNRSGCPHISVWSDLGAKVVVFTSWMYLSLLANRTLKRARNLGGSREMTKRQRVESVVYMWFVS